MLVFFEALVSCECTTGGSGTFRLDFTAFCLHIPPECEVLKKAYKGNGHKVKTRPLCLDYKRAGEKNQGSKFIYYSHSIAQMSALRLNKMKKFKECKISKIIWGDRID